MIAAALIAFAAILAGESPQAAAPQGHSPAPPVTAVPSPGGGRPVLRAGTEVRMRTLEALSSKHARQGQRFALEVVDHVVVEGGVVIPRGAPATGEVARVVGRGIMGKAGKLEVRILFVEAGGARIRLGGRAVDKGKASTGPVVAGTVLLGPLASFVQGTSAQIPAGTAVLGFVYADVSLMPQS
ncbi:hypothetical protein [Allosphingosinicella deserti]|uniref:DUF5666 domain-containing protein n=1 Tax=Allosphingosinicella deserti TaxID=2116704 RepID=A0A2P7QRN7_9SPHN|nr:hypothetical protein [Sphingomonas deserti]PSJ40643.1 hypothetical protein C7I55_10010 [Sphingomonas deserti]